MSLTVTDQPSLLARIDRAIYRLQSTHGLPLQPLGDGGDPEAVLRDCADDHVRLRRVLSELREAVLEQRPNLSAASCAPGCAESTVRVSGTTSLRATSGHSPAASANEHSTTAHLRPTASNLPQGRSSN